MKKRVFFGQNDIRYFYYRYKDSKYYAISIFALTITVCIMLLFGIIIPQIEKYLSIRTEVIAMREKISLINQNISIMSAMDKALLAKQLETVSLALPVEKDFAGILKALSDSSVRAGVTLADFNFSVGEVSSKSAAKANSEPPGSNPSAAQPSALQDNSPTAINALSETTVIDLTVIVSGSIDRVNLFIKEIGEKLPISEVVSINNDKNTTTLNLKFHYKQYPDINYKEDDPIKPLSEDKIQLIEKLSSWRASPSEEIFIPVGTDSAVPLFE